MPLFPWKKVKKGASLSQMVKEHVMNSQRGAGSSPLMVETGFPTSLVDLVVKNRSRFKKKTKKPLSLCSPIPSPSPPPPPSPITITSSVEGLIDDTVSPLIPEVEKKSDLLSMNQGLVVGVLKMFMVVVLVLGMNNLVLGITVSAFLLFFLEYLGKSLYGFFSPVQRRVGLVIQGIFRAKVAELEVDEDCVFKAPLWDHELSKDAGSEFQEIEVLEEPYEEESQCICDGKLKCEGVDVEGVVMEKGEEFRCDLSESKEKKSHRAKMKSKMKKLVPKKFRKKKGSASESHHMILNEGRNEIVGSNCEQKMKSDVSSVASRIDHKTDIVEVVGSTGESSNGLSDASVGGSFKGIDKATIVGEDGFTEIEHNSMYIVLLLVVLVGLIGGRVLALVVTLTCCLMSRRGEGIRRYAKLPVIIRSIPKMFS
ncbi:uncharacterized protein LOC107816147 [Nicotiana tabacum]|uniref:Uncharacterized protein LOC107816147 n=2 Tax=Nicotiana TaxID=4085 RepID=A0A1S4C7U4_TOBAC|nr:PREDICTED: uncharacterized protein LOC104239708 [Nicotiana sylvestris]XP_016497322.1 PREDICTED: uncharacterized protein LOC107816147 [Nicotiana tabacum]